MVSQSTYEILSLEDPDHQWEMHDGRLVEKPAMSVPHNRLMFRLQALVVAQLDIDQFEVRMNTGRLRSGGRTYFIPDVHVIPVSYLEAATLAERRWEAFAQPMPFVAELWSPSTGDYDVNLKLPQYMSRGDLEIWRIHPYDRAVTIWTRREDGSYDERTVSGGIVHPVGLPGVSIDLDRLFNFK